MAKVPEVRLGPTNTQEGLEQAIRQIAEALNRLIRAFNETQED